MHGLHSLLLRCYADRFGPDFRPMGPAACARHGCFGCCYCRGSNSLPVYLQVRTYTWSAGSNAGPWLSIKELRRYISLGSHHTLHTQAPTRYHLTCYAAEPTQLAMAALSVWRAMRAITCLRQSLQSGRSASSAAASSSRLSALLIALDSDEEAAVRTHNSHLWALRTEAEAEWAPLRTESYQLEKQVAWERLTRHSCGERLHSPDSQSAFRVGDIVCAP